MTNEEAIKVLQSLIPVPKRGDTRSTETTEISVALIMAISALSQIESAGTQITNSNLKSESEKPIKHFGSIECPNCGRLLMLEEQTYSWCKGCKEYDTEKHCCYRYSSFIRESLRENINAVLEDIKAEIDKLPRIKVGNSNSPTVKYCIDERLLYEILEKMKGDTE